VVVQRLSTRSIPFCVKRASGFGLCVAYIVLPNRDRTGEIFVEEVGMYMAVAITFAAVVLCGWTLVFIALRELKRDLPSQEL
jgi:hypothetical protein